MSDRARAANASPEQRWTVIVRGECPAHLPHRLSRLTISRSARRSHLTGAELLRGSAAADTPLCQVRGRPETVRHVVLRRESSLRSAEPLVVRISNSCYCVVSAVVYTTDPMTRLDHGEKNEEVPECFAPFAAGLPGLQQALTIVLAVAVTG